MKIFLHIHTQSYHTYLNMRQSCIDKLSYNCSLKSSGKYLYRVRLNLCAIHSFIHSFIFHFIHLQVQPKDVEIGIKCCTMCLLNYRCQITEYNYITMIT